jgi:hypothetical protein
MGDGRWRCRECGTVNEPGSRACSTCGHWASVFELQDPVGDPRRDDVFEVGAFPDPAPVPEPFFEPQQLAPEQQHPFPQPEASASRRWSRLRWVARLLPVAIFLAVLAVNLVGSFAGAEKSHGVTPEDIQRTSGLTGYPFAGSRACDVYVVPLDRPSEDESAAIARFVARRVHVSSCVTPSVALSPEILDAFRHQVNVGLLIDRMIDAFRPIWHKRPSTILGITALDVYWPARPDWRFAFAGTATVGEHRVTPRFRPRVSGAVLHTDGASRRSRCVTSATCTSGCTPSPTSTRPCIRRCSGLMISTGCARNSATLRPRRTRFAAREFASFAGLSRARSVASAGAGPPRRSPVGRSRVRARPPAGRREGAPPARGAPGCLDRPGCGGPASRAAQRSYVTSPLSIASTWWSPVAISRRPSRAILTTVPLVPFTLTRRPRRKSRDPRPS